MSSTQHILTDKFGRNIDYLRLSVTDRCNLRCTYCMPSQGLKFADKSNLLTYEEIYQLIDLLGEMGLQKVRITGGEPFVRSGMMEFLEKLAQRTFLKSIAITSNLTLIAPHIEQLKALGIKSVNVSLDALDRGRFHQITLRDEYDVVLNNLLKMIDLGFDVKVNCVVMKGKNEDQVLLLTEFAKQHPVSVRFLEEMPFNGSGAANETLNYEAILRLISAHYELDRQLDLPNSTSQNYQIPGFVGTVGVIPSFSRTFCGSCNRLRISATGDLRTCLYGGNQLSIRDMLRTGMSDAAIRQAIQQAVWLKPKDGFAAADENNNHYESMTKLGG